MIFFIVTAIPIEGRVKYVPVFIEEVPGNFSWEINWKTV